MPPKFPDINYDVGCVGTPSTQAPASIITITSTSYSCLLPRLAAFFAWRQLVNSFEETSDANSDYIKKNYIIRKMTSFIKIHHRTNIYYSNVNVEHKKSMRQRHMSTIAVVETQLLSPQCGQNSENQTRRYANLSPRHRIAAAGTLLTV